MTFVVLLAAVAAVAQAAVVTIAIGQNSLPARVIVAPHDTLHFINADDKRVHRISARDLPGFDSHDLYPASFPSEKPLPRDFVYTLKGVAEGEYLYFDEYTRTMRGSIVVVAYDNPWFTHPGGAGVVAAGPTRIVGARVAPTRQNPTANQITPASVTAVRVEVALAGTGAAKLGAKLRSGNLLAGPACAAGESSTVRDVDGGKQRLEVFEIDASSLADGQLSFELELDGETYIVPGPVTKRTAVQSFANEHKSVVNVNLS